VDLSKAIILNEYSTILLDVIESGVKRMWLNLPRSNVEVVFYEHLIVLYLTITLSWV
jgi:hypothetical protein